ncbi:nicotinate-nucleotide--dimethylbenzimidazole phosphoribosyltransferase [Streptomyces sp. BV286]|uniref:nicotinate-nucleotide--dimethylbenzimidazole phosphoribosyltransferase n=1 Tax=Streptomyces sp. BV286 TaxID=2849672 RepID=UPI001C2E95A9|nr:nicotinate-nucleotide--dimethylbenzimidazole phosphoribosyltransferase [Streptomyces sp. BV286]MBV1934973.1 nicotinate-nucleotide--dimethylbenzimidazole phosphoribosyltransferase [Streptomyces sp. BV286]
MTDTGQVPGEGLPENAGMVEQPGVPAPGAYTYLSESTAEDEDLLLLPGAQGAWGNEVAPPAPAPVVEAVHEPGPHETAGRDSGSVDLSAVRMSSPAPQPPVARRPLHLGPPTPDGAGSPVRSLADRGPAGAPPTPFPVRQAGPPTSGPEYLDVPRDEIALQGAAPWGAQAQAQVQVAPPVAQVGSEGVPAETVFPAVAEAHAGEPAAVEAAPVAQVPDAEGDASLPEVQGPPVPPEPSEEPAAEQPAEAPQGQDAPGADGPDAAQIRTAADPAEPVQAPEAAQAPEEAYVAPQPEAVRPEEQLAGTAEDVQVPDAAPVTAPVPEPVPEPVLVQDYAQAPQLADGSLFPQAPDGGQGPEFAQAVPEFAHAPQHTPFPAAPAAPHYAHPSEDAGQHAPEAPQAAYAAPDPQPAYPAEPQAPDQAVPFTEAAPHAGVQEPRPEPVEAEPFLADADQVQDPAEAAWSAGPTEPEAVPVQSAEEPEAPQEVPAETAAYAEEPGVAVAHEGHAPEAEAHGEAAALQDGPPEAHAEQPVGQFVPVEGLVPTTPHLAPTPPHAMTMPPLPEEHAEQVAEEAAGPAVVTVEQSDEPAPDSVPDEEPVLVLPAPREPDPAPDAEATPVPEAPVEAEEESPEPVAAQQAEDLDTRAADQEESTAAVARTRESTGPAAPGYDDAEREAVLRVMRERRDIRNGFRSDPIPHDVLLRVLEAAHTAPSVGHSQPWDFVVIRSAETRRTMHELAARQREAYAQSLPKGRAKQFKELKIEAILDTPVNIVVTADPTRGGRHTLGRHTQPQMAPYSSALAVENLWLAARAEGLGVGWVSFFDEREMVRELGLPEHLEVVAYLCVGYVDEFPEEPELMQAGWSKRRPLSWVVHEETYGRRALPGEEPHDLLAETVTNIRPLDAKALGEAWERQKRMTKPAGALGMLEIISAQLSGLSRMCPPPIPEPAAVAIFAGDHGVHAQGVTPWPQEVTGQMVANILGGGAVCNAFATQVGAEVCVVDVGVASDLPATPGLLPRKVRAGTADMTTGPALTREEVRAAIEVGVETARDLVAAGNKALITGEMGIANTTASAALISVFTGADPAEVTGRGTGINDETLARKTEVVRRALELHQPDPADPIGVLAAIGGLEHAAMVGLLLGGASLRTPVILDGVSAGAAALVARAIAPEVLAACIAGHRSAEPGHVAALNKLGLRPLVDLDLRLGEGTGALLALPVVQSAARAMHEVATFDSAGVTEK